MFRPEITHLLESGFLNPRRVLFTPPEMHALPNESQTHLLKRLAQARETFSGQLYEWTGLEVEFHPITLDRFEGLLRHALALTPMVAAVSNAAARVTEA
jgi:hypothetical protein